jgi:DNA repair ATPase RecN
MSSFPGARWWKLDCHAHTPCSTDYGKGSSDQNSLRQMATRDWLVAFMRAGIDCVVVTDHNSGDFVDRATQELERMRESGDAEFRELSIFPGVELTVNGGTHVLGVFGQDLKTSDIDALLGAAEFHGTKGSSDAAANKSLFDVSNLISQRNGVTVLAHIDTFCSAGSLTANTLQPLLASGSVQALEVCDVGAQLIESLRTSRLARVIGSDSHHPNGSGNQRFPGSHFTWVKMGEPSLEGLRLALIDGNGASILRSDETSTDPNAVPDEWIESIEIVSAKVMGRGQPATLSFSPFLTALIGGRGTGKSTVIHLLRAALGRNDEVLRLAKDAEPRLAHERFFRVYQSRDDVGGLTQDTEARLTFHHSGKRFRMTWRDSGSLVEEYVDGNWTAAASQTIRERFPANIFSQGQILELTGRNSTALLDFVDEASGAGDMKKQISEEEARFLSLRARTRELRQKTLGTDALRAQLEDVETKLAAFESSQHASVLREHQRRNRQLREVDHVHEVARQFGTRVTNLADELELPVLSSELFAGEEDSERETREGVAELKTAVVQAAESLRTVASELEAAQQRFSLRIDGDLGERARRARSAYDALVATLKESGVADPNEFDQLVQDRHRLETDLSNLSDISTRAAEVEHEANQSLEQLCMLRKNLWKHRQAFVEETLKGNEYVRINVEPFGSDAEAAERSFRELIGVTDDRFSDDILNGSRTDGLIHGLFASAPGDGIARCEEVRERLTKLRLEVETGAKSFGGHFKNFLMREAEKRPEFLDRIALWDPGDGVRIEYSPRGDGKDFRPVAQGSAGQRSAAVLAFFLAYGDEPLILDQPEDDLDNHLIYDLIVRQLRESKKRRQVIVVTHNPNIVVNGDAELIYVMDFRAGQCVISESGCLQHGAVREEVCRVMEGGREAFQKRYERLGGRNDLR